MPEQEVRNVVAFVRQHATMAPETAAPSIEVRDPNDLPILAAALAGSAEVLVSGDKDLLVLARVDRLQIVDPRGFWRLAKADE